MVVFNEERAPPAPWAIGTSTPWSGAKGSYKNAARL